MPDLKHMGSEKLREYLEDMALTLHQFGTADSWRRTNLIFEKTEVSGLDVPIVVAKMTIVSISDPKSGEVMTFDATCYGDSCFVDSIYFFIEE